MPSNTSAATALAMSPLPFQVAHVVTAGTDLWYSYTPVEGDTSLSFWAFGDLAGYAPETWIYTGSPTSLTPYLGGVGPSAGKWATNLAVQVPITLGTTYYFKVVSGTSGTATVTAVRAPHLSAPAGSLLIPDDSEGFPGIILSQTTGAVLQAIHPFPPGEAGDVLADGTMAVEDYVNNSVQIYGPDLSDGPTVAFQIVTSRGGSIRTNKATDVWYAVQGGSPGIVKRITADGTITDTWTLTGQNGIDCIASSNDEATLYFAKNSGSGATIYTWDLVGDVLGADLYTDATTYIIWDILVLPDDSILASFIRAGDPVVQVRRISAAGALLETYDFGIDHAFPSLTFPRLAYALSDDEFWFWSHLASVPGTSIFYRVDIETGEILTQFTVREYEVGTYNATATSAPDARFGISFSCPLIVLRAPIVTMMVDESIPCCEDSASGGGEAAPAPCGDCPPSPITAPSGSPSSAPVPTSTGPVLPPVNTMPESGAPTPIDPPYWDRLCAGAGTVPEEADPSDYESWVRQ